MKPKIFVTQPIPQVALDALGAHGEVSCNPDASRILPKADLIAGVKGADVLFSLLHDVVDTETVRANPNLKVIATMCITPVLVDVATATELKIPVTHVPPWTTDATADLAMALALAAARNLIPGDRGLREGLFPGGQSAHYLGRGLARKTMGILGMGRIGEAVARRARGFDMEVLYLKRTRLAPEQEKELGATFATQEELLARSDFVVVAATSTPETHHLVGAEQLARMKPTAFLVNVARGPLVDEAALVEALRAGTIAGAGLDVYENEPQVHPGLIGLENTVLLPHLGSAVVETRERMALKVVENIVSVLEGRRPPELYNPEIYD